MALPSQTERQSEIGRSYVYGQRTAAANGARTVLIVAAVLVLAAGTIWGTLTVINRRSTTGTLPGPETKSINPRQVSLGAISPETDKGAKPSTPDSPSPRIAPAGGTAPTSLKTDAPIMPPPGSPTTVIPSASTTDASRRPAPVDVTRKDLTPNPAPTPTTSGSGTDSANPSSPSQTANLTPTDSTSDVIRQIQAADQRLAAGDLLQARVLLNKALRNPNAVRDDQDRIRQKLTSINADVLFGAKVFSGDPMAEEYTVKSGDNLIRIARNRELAIDWRLLERINSTKSGSLRIGQKLKLIRGPFHAIVHKGDYRLDLFQGSPDDPDSWIYIRSFKVGLGTGNSTPVGSFVIKPKSKLVNPYWVNPQTGQKFAADDPKNPIGEFWMGIEGVGDSKAVTGYGLHGTIDPDSIGKQQSMGCVRLGDEDIKLLYEMLAEQFSVVKIVP